jgi:hypothetical protein
MASLSSDIKRMVNDSSCDIRLLTDDGDAIDAHMVLPPIITPTITSQ